MYIDIDNDACSVWQSVGSICAGKPDPQIMLFARVRDYALCGSQSGALSGSTPDYPDDEHETLCGCLCLCVYSSSLRANEMNFVLGLSVCLSVRPSVTR